MSDTVECAWRVGAILGEGPVYDARFDAVVFVDIKGRRLHRLNLASGDRSSWEAPDLMCWAAPRTRPDGYIAGVGRKVGLLHLHPFRFEPMIDLEERPGFRLNDAKVDASGRLWCGSMDDAEADEDGRLYAVSADWAWRVADSGYRVANGPTFSRGGRFVYHTDSARRLIYRFECAAGGRLEGKEILVRFEESWGYPDGMTTDAEGCLWVAHWDGGRVSRFSPEGKLERSIKLPVSRVTSCCFAGPNLDRLFVTTAAIGCEEQPLAGGLFEIDPGVKGLPSTPFPG